MAAGPVFAIQYIFYLGFCNNIYYYSTLHMKFTERGGIYNISI